MRMKSISEDKVHVVGIDLGGTSVRVGLFASDCTLVDTVTFKTRVSDGPKAVVADMAESIRTLERRHNVAVHTIGIGSPGPLDLAAGKLLQLPNFPGWDNFPLRDELSRSTRCKVVLESDANVAALAEAVMGAGKTYNVDSLVMWTLGTGVGGGIVLDNKVWRGCNDMAGELGHLSVDADGLHCSCGGQGCIERYASATAIAQAGREWFQRNSAKVAGFDWETITTATMADLADQGNSGMLGIFADVGARLGFAISQIVNTLDVPLYVVGGGVANAWHLFAPSLLSTVEKYSYVYRLGKASNRRPIPMIVPAELGSGAGLLGASLIARAQ
jgi:glucokinase